MPAGPLLYSSSQGGIAGNRSALCRALHVSHCRLSADECPKALLKLLVLGSVDERVDATVAEDGDHSEVVKCTGEVDLVAKVVHQKVDLVPDPAKMKQALTTASVLILFFLALLMLSEGAVAPGLTSLGWTLDRRTRAIRE